MAGPVSSRAAGGMVLDVDQKAFVRVAGQLRREADGKELRKELMKTTKAALQPAVSELRGAILAMPSSGDPRKGPPLRQTIAARVRVEVRLSGKTPGARIKVRKTPSLRGFANAPMRTNRRAGWRHPVFSEDRMGSWVSQTGKPGWFDDTLKPNQEKYRRAVLAAVEEMARRVASRMRSL